MTYHAISGYCAFTHKAGIHAKAILNNPSTYEILKPEDFGLTRYVSIGYVFFHQHDNPKQRNSLIIATV